MDLRPLGLLLLGTAWAGQLWSAPPEGLPVAQIINQRSGFTGAYPRAVVTDSEGRLWVCTDLGGLYVGDGLRFLKVELPEPLKGRGIVSMATDRLGRIWVLSSGGLGTWEKGAWHVDSTICNVEATPRRRTEGILAHPNGTLVVLASSRAYRLREGVPPKELALPGDETQGDLSLVWRGERLVANRGGTFWREEAQGWVPLPSLALPTGEQPPGAICCDADGHLYQLTDHHLYHLAPEAEAWHSLDYVPSGSAERMTQLQDGHIWILQNGRAVRGRGGVLSHQGMPRDLSLYGAEAQHLDPEGNLWITRTDLVRIPALGLILTHSGSGFPPAREVWNIQRDMAGSLWVSSEGGLYRRDSSGWRGVENVPSAHAFKLGPDGWLYLRSHRQLLRVEPRTLRAMPVPIPLQPGGLQIRRGPVIQGNRMWVVDTERRLAVGTFNHGAWAWAWETNLPEANGNPYLLQDEQGRIWLGLDRRQYCYMNGRWEEIPLPGGRALVDLTFPTPDQGLAVQFNPPSVIELKRTVTGWTTRRLLGKEELQGIGTLYAVRQDAKGFVWLNTDRGVVRAELGGPPRLQRYGIDLGLPADDTNQEALLVEEGGRLWVGTALGLAEIRSNEGPQLPPLSAPSLLEARCGTWVQKGAQATMTIRWGQGSAVWELGFPGPVRGEGAHFEFREAGGSWAALAGTALQFPEISPGHHSYDVRVVPFLGQPGPLRRLELHVLPPWYRHPLAYTFWGLILGGSVFLGFRWRLLRLKRRNLELSLAVTQATEGLRAREQDLERVNRRLYELNDAKNRIIGLAAHDLRNPLSGILLNCELLEEDLQVPDAAKSLGAIRSLGSTMKGLIQRLLDVHAIEAGHAEAPQMIVQDLEAAVVDAMERARNASERKGITLAFAFPGPALALGDFAQVGQILDNLLSNAIKFSPSGTTITLGLDADDSHWRVSVKDQGPGLTTADLDLVFGEYARLSAQPTAGEASVGLGLSLVKRMAEAMGGRVGVESVQGQGATFWLALPKA